MLNLCEDIIVCVFFNGLKHLYFLICVDSKFNKIKLNKNSILNLSKNKIEIVKTFVDKNNYCYSN